MILRSWSALGFAGQALFTARVLVQWIASERARRVVVPSAFWWLSLSGSLLVLAYALFQHDPVFVLSTLPGAFIYGRNLAMRKSAPRAVLTPVALAAGAFVAWAAATGVEPGPLPWAIVGGCGSVIWSGRFVVQWWISERRGVPTLPVSFWVMSLVGVVLLLAYAIGRRDPVMIAGFSLGGIPYARNLALGLRERRGTRADSL